MARSKAHKQQVRAALNDEYLQIALNRAAGAYRKARAEAMAGFDLAAAQDQVREIKERSIADLRQVFERFRAEAEKVGTVIHEAADGAATAEIVRKLAEERGVSLIVKSKSMLTEEIELNARLAEHDLEVVETDLGEWIVQLAGEKPSHFTAPAVHKTREQIAELFSKVVGEDVDADIPKLVAIARSQLRQKFFDAQMGISGANVAIAETGTLVIVSNEGNARLVTTLPPIHVAIVGYEKLVETMDDATAILKVLARSGTGQKQTAYVSFITGPSRTMDIEKTLTLGVHGPGELHIIFVDSGRTAMAADEALREALYCIKCGACLNMCPVYESIGGHAFGNAYMGGIGAVVTAYHRSLEAAEDTLELCAGCGYCREICPARVDVPRMVLELRHRLVMAHGIPVSAKLPMSAMQRPKLFQAAVRMARAMQSPVVDGGMLKDLRIFTGLAGSKRFPALAPQFLRETLPECSGDQGNMSVVFYAGCMIDFFYPEIGQAIWDVLTKSGARALFPKDQPCCGAPALYLGDRDTARKAAQETIAVLEANSPSHIVTGCPSCAVMLTRQFPVLLAGTAWEERAKSVASRVMDFSRFAVEVLDLRLDRTREGRITYHDPCHLVRGLETSEFPRALIERTGLELVEMEDSDQCCGFAGSYSVKNIEVSGAILNRKLAHIEETGTGIVATDCPGCVLQIRGGLLKRERPTEVCHTAQLIASLME